MTITNLALKRKATDLLRRVRGSEPFPGRVRRSARLRRRSVLLETLEPRCVLDSTAVFNELMYHPRVNDGPEWIEIYNQQGVDLDISGWQLGGGIEYTFPAGTVMDGGEYLVISANPAISGIPQAMGPFTGSMANNGEEIVLMNNSGRVMDRINYLDDFPWPVEADGTGSTLAKRQVNTGSDDAANWRYSTQTSGTPGGINFPSGAPVFANVDFISPGSSTDVHIPTTGALGTDWTGPNYVLGSRGETWTPQQPTVGYFVGDPGETYQTSVLTDNPLTYWRFDETSPQSAAVNQGTLGAGANGTYGTTARVGAASLIGDNNDRALRISVEDTETPFRSPPFEKVGTTGRTTEFWVRLDALPARDVNLVGDAVAALDFGMTIAARTTGRLRVNLRTAINFPGISAYDTERALVVGETVHVVASWDATTGVSRIFLDGIEAVQVSPSGPTPNLGAPIETNNTIFVGRDGRTTTNVSATIDEVAFYNYVLGTDRIAAHYAAGGPKFVHLIDHELTGMHNVSSSVYLRKGFTVPDDVDLQRITMNVQYDDAFVAYVDGVEVARRNVAGSPQFNSTATSSRSFEQVRQAEDIQLISALENLQPGPHTLAIHALNVAATDPDFLFGFSLSGFGTEIPPTPAPQVSFNEISAATDPAFRIELRNDSNIPTNLQDYRLVVDGTTVHEQTFPSQILQPGSYAVITAADLGFRPSDGDKLILYNGTKTLVVDAREVTGRLRGRSPDDLERWLYPATETPGTANDFDTTHDIVINEIMYRAPIERATPAVIDTVTLVPFTVPWRYNNRGTDLGVGWQATSHTVDSTNWFQGTGPVGRTTDVLPVPLGTTFSTFNTSTITYYFETDFTYNGTPDGYDLALSHMIDDGAVIYVNGQELTRVRMPSGAVIVSTRANQAIANATIGDPLVISDDLFVIGQNRISVEVHMASIISTEVVMGLSLIATKLVTPAHPETEPTEQWIELYNRGDQPVNLTGWSFADGITYDFAPGTILAPDQYLVVANESTSLAAKYPSIRVVGDFEGTISRAGERLELVDARGNPVDVVDFRDSGRWDGLADGGGSSLELRDPDADNRLPEVWQASDETSSSEWQTITYRGRATNTFGPTNYNELVLGLLDSGEILLDDIRVVEDPNGVPRQLIQNGTFENDTVGGPAGLWRIIGTHEESRVIVDPDNPNNKVLKLVATGPTEHMHNHAETTLKFENTFVTINATRDYEISFRARWLSGSDQLNSRLYFNRLARTTLLSRPVEWGTPGERNSQYEANIGPTYTHLAHAPTIPEPTQDVLVTVDAADPDGIASMTLYYAVDGVQFQTVAMTSADGSRYTGLIPARPAGTIVQFYVQGTDSQGGISTFPADGAASRALYVVKDGRAGNLGSHNLRIVMTTADANRLHTPTNVMSNARIGGTLIYDESEVYYDIGVRLKGSERGRNENVRVGFNIDFDPLQLFRGAQDTIGIDRSGAGDEFSQKEVLVKQTLNHAGGVTDLQDDLIYVIAPRTVHTGSALLQMSRYKDNFLDTQYENGSDGELFKYELVYFPTTTTGGPEGLKIPEPDDVTGVSVRYRGDNKEDYRWNFLIRNNLDEDNYSRLTEAIKVFSLSGAAFHEQSQKVLDVDQWLRSFAVQTLWGVGDNYATGGQHNAYFYVRPEDGKLLYLPHDVDFSGSSGETSGLSQSGDLNLLLSLAENQHYYYGHIHDIITTSFNSAYMNPWIDHYGTFLTSPSLQGYKTYIANRSTFALNTIRTTYPTVDFAITTNGGANLVVTEPNVTLAGSGWVNVREIRLAGSSVPLPIRWPTATGWQVTLPVASGSNALTFEAYDLQGTLLGMDTITVTSSANNPVVDALRVTEINYHPGDPTIAELAAMPTVEAEDFEFIEVMNTGANTINPVGARFTSGIDFTFPSINILAGERVIIARNTAAFRLRYGTGITPIGQFASGQLSNAGERLTLATGLGVPIVDFSYADSQPWPQGADGIGATLELRDATTTPTNQLSGFQAWEGSVVVNGTPGTAPVGPIGIVINEVLASSTAPAAPYDALELFNTTTAPINIGGWYISDTSDDLFKYQIPAGTILEPHGYWVVDERSFNPTPTTPGPHDFALSGTRGDDVWLVVPTAAGTLSMFVDHVQFNASTLGTTLGRVPDGSDTFTSLSRIRLGCENADAQLGAVTIAEIQANPGVPSTAALAIDPAITADDLEFIELYNTTTAAVDLTGWRVRGGADYDFSAGQSIASGESLVVVTFDPVTPENVALTNAFRAHYGIAATVRLVGGLSGQLRDAGEAIDLQRPGTPPDDDPTFTPRLSEDLLYYASSTPWPAGASGTGMSLQKRNVARYGNNGASWAAAIASPGAATFAPVVTGDVNADGSVNAADIDLFLDELRHGRSLSHLDLDGNLVVNANDAEFLVQNVFGTRTGDANLDQRVDATDFGLWNANRFSDCESWTTGDFNGDGRTDGTDFNLWNQNKFFAAAAERSSTVRRTPRMPIAASETIPQLVLRDEALRTYRLSDHDAVATELISSGSVTTPEVNSGRAQYRRLQAGRAARIHRAHTTEPVRTSAESVREIEVFSPMADQVFASNDFS